MKSNDMMSLVITFTPDRIRMRSLMGRRMTLTRTRSLLRRRPLLLLLLLNVTCLQFDLFYLFDRKNKKLRVFFITYWRSWRWIKAQREHATSWASQTTSAERQVCHGSAEGAKAFAFSCKVSAADWSWKGDAWGESAWKGDAKCGDSPLGGTMLDWGRIWDHRKLGCKKKIFSFSTSIFFWCGITCSWIAFRLLQPVRFKDLNNVNQENGVADPTGSSRWRRPTAMVKSAEQSAVGAEPENMWDGEN